MVRETTLWEPENRLLLCGVCLVQLTLIVLPFLAATSTPVIVFMVLFSAVALFGSVTTAVLYLCLTAAMVPTWFYNDYLLLPMDFKFYEGLFMIIGGLAGMTWLLEGRLDWPNHTRLDRPMFAFLVLLVFSMGLGLYYGQSTSEMLRDVRYPLYYALFFVVTGFFDSKKASLFLNLMLVIAAGVGVEYLVEFFSMVNLAVAGAFYRVGRLEGVVLPIGVLIASAVLVYSRSVQQRFGAVLMLLPAGLALMMTVGRGMWIAMSIGLGALGMLIFMDRRAGKTRIRRLLTVVAIPFVLVGLLFGFQDQTHTGISQVAVKRISSAVDYKQDQSIVGRLLSYRTALGLILKRPLLGGGHGATVTFPVTDLNPPTVVTLGAVDNVYLTIGIRMGLVGIAAFLWVYCQGLWLAYRLFQRSQNGRTRLFCAAFISVYSMMLVYGAGDATLMVNRLIFIHSTFLGLLGRLNAEEDAWTISTSEG